MSRAVFIGDSHTCGFIAVPGKYGPGSYSYWNDNSYGDIYSEENNSPVSIYAMAGVNNRVYVDWLKTMFERHNDITEVFLCLAPMNRFCLAVDPGLVDEPIPVDNFTIHIKSSSTELVQKYGDHTEYDDRYQLFNKPMYADYDKQPMFELTPESGLVRPDIRKESYIDVKLFFELNTYLEKRDFLQNVYSWDNICADHNAKLYLFNFTDRLVFPSNFEYYGKLKCTKFAPKSVQGFFAQRMIDHKKYLLEDNEHYNKTYHHMVATQYIPWLKTL